MPKRRGSSFLVRTAIALIGPETMIDIHCHILPGIDDGAKDLPTSIAMARMAVEDGITTVIATPHQLGNFRANTGAKVRAAVDELQRHLAAVGIPLVVLPGGDVRIEPDLTAKLQSGDVVSLGDNQRYVLLELPHELYFPLSPLLRQLDSLGVTGILSHPERNQGILAKPSLVNQLVDEGCLMQVTGSSLVGGFGSKSQQVAEALLKQGLIHFLATDAHGLRSRRPRLSTARLRASELTDEGYATDLCETLPGLVARGEAIARGPRSVCKPQRKRIARRAVTPNAKVSRWFNWARPSSESANP